MHVGTFGTSARRASPLCLSATFSICWFPFSWPNHPYSLGKRGLITRAPKTAPEWKNPSPTQICGIVDAKMTTIREPIPVGIPAISPRSCDAFLAAKL